MKSTLFFLKDLDPKFGTVNNRTDMCYIAIEQNTLYSIAASEVAEIYFQENLAKIPGKYLQGSLLSSKAAG